MEKVDCLDYLSVALGVIGLFALGIPMGILGTILGYLSRHTVPGKIGLGLGIFNFTYMTILTIISVLHMPWF